MTGIHADIFRPRTTPILRVIVFALALLAGACSAPKEEVKPVIPEVKLEPLTPPPPARVFEFEDRYFVRGASIDLETNIDDPLQAIRVIQIKQGESDVLVISSFEKAGNDRSQATETWFGLELASLAPGRYPLSSAKNARFFRFLLGDKPERLDGKSYEGFINIEEIKDGYITGTVSATVTGVSKSFEKPSMPFSMPYSGSFRIREVPLEATVIKTK